MPNSIDNIMQTLGAGGSGTPQGYSLPPNLQQEAVQYMNQQQRDSFPGWLASMGIDPRSIPPEQLADLRRQYDSLAGAKSMNNWLSDKRNLGKPGGFMIGGR